jgi:hypothetical protein
VRDATFEIHPLAARKLQCRFGKTEQSPAFQAMQRDGAVNLVRLDVHASVNDEAYDLERFRFNDGSRPRVL